MSYPTMTRRSYEEFVELIKRAEWLSLSDPLDKGKKVQIWYNYETGEFEFSAFDPKHQFVEEHYKQEFIEVYRVKPHNLKSLYSKTRRWKDAIDWKDDHFACTEKYGELVEFHINRIHESKFDIKGKIREAFLRYNINGEGLELDYDDGYYDDGSGEMDDEGSLDYDDQLVNWEGKSREDIEDELYGEDDDEY